jgi:hypothetical protein
MLIITLGTCLIVPIVLASPVLFAWSTRRDFPEVDNHPATLTKVFVNAPMQWGMEVYEPILISFAGSMGWELVIRDKGHSEGLVLLFERVKDHPAYGRPQPLP